MGHLAQFSSFFNQGEVLCTQSLTYLLQNAEARKVFSEHIANCVGVRVRDDLIWKAEACQSDGGRCDLEGSVEGKPVVKIEAKLGASLGEAQFRAYLKDLQERCGSGGILLALVPRSRGREITNFVSGQFSGEGPWHLSDASGCSIAVIFWEDVLAALSAVKSEPFSGDYAQFQAMYRVLKGYDIEPPTSDADVLAWREKEGNYVNLVDYVTRRLTRDEREQVLPMGTEGPPNDFRRRYVCLPLGSDYPCFSIGTRDPFNGHKTPIWMRFNRTTPKFPIIEERLLASNLSERLVQSSGHIWIPLDVQLNVDGDHQVDFLLQQAEEIIRVAYQPLP